MTATPTNSSRLPSGGPTPIVYVARGGPVDGSGRQLVYLLRELDRTRFQPLVLLDTGGGLMEELTALNVPVRVTPMRPWRSLRGFFQGRLFDSAAALRIARRNRPAIVHCSDTWRTPYAAYIARRLRIPLLAHVRGPTQPRDLKKNDCLAADAIVGIAERYRAEIAASAYPADQIDIIDDAVDTVVYRRDESARATVRESLGIPPAAVAVGLVGRVEPLKRVIEFVDAVAAVPRDLNTTFLIVGSTRREEFVEEVRRRIADLNLADRVRLIGRRDDMPAVLSALDLLATFSGGSVMFEAMACRVPVLSVRPDGRHSQHTEHDQTAWCVTTDHAAIAGEALRHLMEDASLRDRLGEAGRLCVAERLAPQSMARRTEAIYDRLMSACASARD